MPDETIKALIRRIKYTGTNDFGIAAATGPPDSGLGQFDIKGPIAKIAIDTLYELNGVWEVHPRYGRQFKVTTYQMVYPTDLEGISRYLRNNIKWLGPVRSNLLLETFGDQTLDMLRDYPVTIAAKISGITIEKAKEISNEMLARRATEALLVELEGIFAGTLVNRTVLAEVAAVWGQGGPEKIRENPYALIDGFHGVGFLVADSVARKLGVPFDSPFRIAAGIIHTMQQHTMLEGHICFPKLFIISMTSQLLKIDQDKVLKVLNKLLEDRPPAIVMEGGFIYFVETLVDEHYIAERIRELMSVRFDPVRPDLTSLHPDQAEALRQIAVKGAGVFILTGPPGCLSASTTLSFRRGARNGGRTYTVAEAYHRFNGISLRSSKARKGEDPEFWKGKRNRFWATEFPTETLSYKPDTKSISYHEIEAIVYSGVKQTYTVHTESGNWIRVTDEHPFRVPDGTHGADLDGFKQLRNLKVNDLVLCRHKESTAPGEKKEREYRRMIAGITFHPFAWKQEAGGFNYKRLPYARLVIEAEMNGLTAEELIEILRTDESLAESLTFLPPELEVHHIDEDCTNDDRSNLAILTHEGHARHHGHTSNHFGNQNAVAERITKIEEYGLEDTFDLVMKAPYHNYVANDFVVHNTGKTFTIKRMISTFDSANVLQVAPTGKAAKRVQEQSGMEAKTIHRALEPMPRDVAGDEFIFRRNEDNPFEHDLIICDEASMLDQWLFASLLRAIKPESRLILVGDVGQLPSVGPGNILKDLIAAGIPTVELDHIKRQDAGLIVKNCFSIRKGFDIDTPPPDPASDFMFIPRRDEASIQSAIITLLERLQSATYNGGKGYNVLDDVQVIVPRRSQVALSCEKLNPILQETLVGRPPGSTSHYDGNGKLVETRTKFQEGDKVIQTRNDYKHEIMNGDIGRVLTIAGGLITVRFDNPIRAVDLPLVENDLELAYVITCHKFQGSEAKVVIVPIHKSGGALVCQRNWAITAFSRASKLCIVIGEREEITKIIQRRSQQARYTRLQLLLKQPIRVQPR